MWAWLLFLVVGILVFFLIQFITKTIINTTVQNSTSTFVILTDNGGIPELIGQLNSFFDSHFCANLTPEWKRMFARMIAYELYLYKQTKVDKSGILAVRIALLGLQACGKPILSNSIASSIQSIYTLADSISFDGGIFNILDKTYLPLEPIDSYYRVNDLTNRVTLDLVRVHASFDPFQNSGTFPTFDVIQQMLSGAIVGIPPGGMTIQGYFIDLLYSMAIMTNPAFTSLSWYSIYQSVYKIDLQREQRVNELTRSFCGVPLVPCNTVKGLTCQDPNSLVCPNKIDGCGVKSLLDSPDPKYWATARYYCADTSRIGWFARNYAWSKYRIGIDQIYDICHLISDDSETYDQKKQDINQIFQNLQC